MDLGRDIFKYLSEIDYKTESILEQIYDIGNSEGIYGMASILSDSIQNMNKSLFTTGTNNIGLTSSNSSNLVRHSAELIANKNFSWELKLTNTGSVTGTNLPYVWIVIVRPNDEPSLTSQTLNPVGLAGIALELRWGSLGAPILNSMSIMTGTTTTTYSLMTLDRPEIRVEDLKLKITDLSTGFVQLSVPINPDGVLDTIQKWKILFLRQDKVQTSDNSLLNNLVIILP